MSFSELKTEILELVKAEPKIQELRKQIEVLCNGSQFERESLEYHFEKAIRDTFKVIGPQRKWDLRQDALSLLSKGVKEFQQIMPGLSKQDAEAMTSERDSQIKKTVEEFIQRSLDLCDKFGSEVERLSMQAFEHRFKAWDETANSKVDGMIEQKLLKMPESIHKAIISQSAAERQIHFSDLTPSIFKRYLEKNNGHERGDTA